MSDALPDGWVAATLEDAIDGFQSGRNLKAHGRPAANGEFGVLKISAATWGRFNPEENKALLPGDAPKPREVVRGGDLLITRANTTELVGAVVLVDRDWPKLMLPDKILRLLVRRDAVARGFLLHALRSHPVRTFFQANASGTSDSMRNLSQAKLLRTPLAIPPLNEQRRIVEKIDALMARSRRAKEALDAIPPLLERFRRSVLAAAFRGDLTADWRAENPDVEPADKLLERIRVERRRRWEEDYLGKQRAKGKEPKNDKWKAKYKEPEPIDKSGLPELPSGWSWCSLDQLTEVITSGSRGWKQYYNRGSGVFIMAGNVRPGRLDLSTRMVVDPPRTPGS